MHGVTVSSSSCTKCNLLKMSVCGINNNAAWSLVKENQWFISVYPKGVY